MKAAVATWTILIGALSLLPGGAPAQSNPAPPPSSEFSEEAPPTPKGITAGLLGSKHDFAPPNAPLIEHCVACHGRPAAASRPAPLSAEFATDKILAESQLQDTSSTPTAFTSAASQPLRFAKIPARSHPNRSTQLCLSCHDGTIAGFIAAGDDELTRITPLAHVDIQHDHPVGVPYPRTSSGFRPAFQVIRAGSPLPDGRVECVSCHDPHDAWGQRAMLVMSNRRSALCLNCHIK